MNTPARPIFDAEQARLAAAAHLPSELFVEFQRLAKTLIHGPAFQLLMVDCRDERLRARVLASLGELQQRAGLRGVEVVLHEAVAGDVSALESRLIEAARDHEVIHLLGASVWMDDAAWQSFNLVRERLAVQVRVRLVFWLNEAAITRVARHAPDIWAWRGGVYAFVVHAPVFAEEEIHRHSLVSAERVRADFDNRSMKERYQRMAEIRSLLSSTSTLSDDLRAPLLEELAGIQVSLGESQQVIDLVEREILPLADRMADSRLMAEAWTHWADAKNSLGDPDVALQTYREKILPIQVRRSDEREVAMTHGRIADILRSRGQLDEALRIRLEEQLPVYERLGAVREKAVTQGRIADILQSRGQFDEALRIRLEEELPVYERLGFERDLLVGRTNLAMALHQRRSLKDRNAIHVLLKRAYAAAKRLGLPEALQIAALYRQIFRKPIETANK